MATERYHNSTVYIYAQNVYIVYSERKPVTVHKASKLEYSKAFGLFNY